MTIGPKTHDGSSNDHYVKINGTKGELQEQLCDANFYYKGRTVYCSLSSGVNIGEYRCMKWRHDKENDGSAITKVLFLN